MHSCHGRSTDCLINLDDINLGYFLLGRSPCQCVSYSYATALQGSPTHPPQFLSHPLEDARPIDATAPPHLRHEGQWKGEAVIWTSKEIGYAATYHEVSARHRTGQIVQMMHSA